MIKWYSDINAIISSEIDQLSACIESVNDDEITSIMSRLDDLNKELSAAKKENNEKEIRRIILEIGKLESKVPKKGKDVTKWTVVLYKILLIAGTALLISRKSKVYADTFTQLKEGKYNGGIVKKLYQARDDVEKDYEKTRTYNKGIQDYKDWKSGDISNDNHLRLQTSNIKRYLSTLDISERKDIESRLRSTDTKISNQAVMDIGSKINLERGGKYGTGLKFKHRQK